MNSTKEPMSSISPVTSGVAYTPPAAKAVPPAAAAASAASTVGPGASVAPAAGTGASAPAPSGKAAAAPAAKTAASSQGSYRNADGDTVSFSGVVLKDRDGDGGVGLPAAKAKSQGGIASPEQKLTSTYSAH